MEFAQPEGEFLINHEEVSCDSRKWLEIASSVDFLSSLPFKCETQIFSFIENLLIENLNREKSKKKKEFLRVYREFLE